MTLGKDDQVNDDATVQAAKILKFDTKMFVSNELPIVVKKLRRRMQIHIL